jgi:hypothetical protein
MDSNLITLAVTVIVGLVGGATGAACVSAFAKRDVTSAEADNVNAQTADILLGRQQDQLDHGDKERAAQRAEIAALKHDMSALREMHMAERAQCTEDLEALRAELMALAKQVARMPPPHPTLFPNE